MSYEEYNESFVPSPDVFHDAETLLFQLKSEELGEIDVDVDALGGLSIVVCSIVHSSVYIWFSLLNYGSRSVLVTTEKGDVA